VIIFPNANSSYHCQTLTQINGSTGNGPGVTVFVETIRGRDRLRTFTGRRITATIPRDESGHVDWLGHRQKTGG
jgi:hypothetical protein